MRIPTYEMRGSTTTESGSVKIAADTYGQAGKNMETLGAAVADASFKVKQLYDEEQALKSQTNMTMGSAALKTEMENDVNLAANKKSYETRFTKLREDSLKMVENPATRNGVSLKFDEEKMHFDYAYSTKYRSQQLTRTKASVIVDADVMRTAWPTYDEAQKKQKWMEFSGRIDGYVAGNLMEADEAENAKIKQREYISKEEWDRKENTASLGGKEAADYFKTTAVNEPDFFGNYLDGTEKLKRTKSVTDTQANLTKQAAAQQKENSFQYTVKTVQDISNNVKDFGTLDVAAIAQYNPVLAGNIQKYKAREDFEYSTGDASYMAEKQFADTVKTVFEIKDNETVDKFITTAIGSKITGVNGAQKLGILAFVAKQRGMANRPTTPAAIKANDWLSNVKSAVGAISKFSPGNSERLGNELLRRVVVKKLESPEQIAAERDAVTVMGIRNNVEGIDHLKKADGTPGVPNKILEGYGPVEDVYGGENQLEGDVYEDRSRDFSSQE